MIAEVVARFPEWRREFGKPTKIVSNVAELEEAVANAKDGDVIALMDGEYRLTKFLGVSGIKLMLAAQSGDCRSVKIVSDRSDAFIIDQMEERGEIALADLTIEAPNDSAVRVIGGGEVAIARCSLSAGGKIGTICCQNGSVKLSDCKLVNDCDRLNMTAMIAENSVMDARRCNFDGQVRSSVAQARRCFKNANFTIRPPREFLSAARRVSRLVANLSIVAYSTAGLALRRRIEGKLAFEDAKFCIAATPKETARAFTRGKAEA